MAAASLTLGDVAVGNGHARAPRDVEESRLVDRIGPARRWPERTADHVGELVTYVRAQPFRRPQRELHQRAHRDIVTRQDQRGPHGAHGTGNRLHPLIERHIRREVADLVDERRVRRQCITRREQRYVEAGAR